MPTTSKPEATQTPAEARRSVPISEILQQLHDGAPPDHFTLGWLMNGLRGQSFGVVMLLLAVLAIAPGVCLVPALLLMIAASQMIAGRPTPVFPRWLAARPLPTRHLGAIVQRAVPVMRHLERAIHPRWPVPSVAARCLVGIAVILLSARLILAPFPLSNILPALVMVLILLAWLENDGLVLAIALLLGFGVLAVDLWLVRRVILGAEWISRFW